MGLAKQYLATTGISEMWDLGNPEILFLGPWCFSENKNRGLIEGRPYSIIPSPWKPLIKLKEAADLCNGFYEELLCELCGQLNLVHNLFYPEGYWRIIIGPWLRYFIEIVYERYCRIEQAFKLYPDAYTWVLPVDSCRLSVSDTYDFVSIQGKATEDYYNLKLFSLIARYLYPEKTIEKYPACGVEAADNPGGRPWGFMTQGRSFQTRIINRSRISKRLFYLIKQITKVFSSPDIILSDMYHFNFMQILGLEFSSFPNKVIFKNFNNRDSGKGYEDYSENLRGKLRFEVNADKFNILLRQLIPGAIPMCYMENFNQYKKRIKAREVKAVGSAVGWYFNENFKFFAAEEMLKGAKLIDFQHGGGYGILLACSNETVSLEKDIFYTWGWRSRNSGKTIPLANPHLSELWNTHKPAKNSILLIGNNIHKYLCRFMTMFTPDDLPQYFKDKKRFFCALDKPAKEILLYRPYQEIGWHELDILKDLITDLEISSRNKLTKLMQGAKIAVIDHLGTANLEALAINVPTIWFWDPNIWLIRPEAEKYFDLLRQAGILYNSPEEAARKVNEINDDPLGWWHDSRIQKARDLFCKELAFTSTNWRKEWIDALNVYR